MKKLPLKPTSVLDRAKAPTPPFFKKLRNIGLVMTTISTIIITAPVSIPSTLIAVAGYIGVAGGVMSAVSQLTTVKQSKTQK